MLTDDGIISRRMRYGCCALDYLNASIEAEVVGDASCQKKNWNLYLRMEFAKSVMDGVPVGDEDGCVSLDEATRVAKWADCICVCDICQREEVNCTITPDETAILVLCDTLLDGWVLSGAGDVFFNKGFLPTSSVFPDVVPGSQAYTAEDGILVLWESIEFDLWCVGYAGVPEIPFYMAPTLDGPWESFYGLPPVPVSRQLTLGDLCESGMTAEQRLAMAVENPVEGTLYAMTCCGENRLFRYENGGGFDYDFDFGLN